MIKRCLLPTKYDTAKSLIGKENSHGVSVFLYSFLLILKLKSARYT